MGAEDYPFSQVPKVNNVLPCLKVNNALPCLKSFQSLHDSNTLPLPMHSRIDIAPPTLGRVINVGKNAMALHERYASCSLASIGDDMCFLTLRSDSMIDLIKAMTTP